MWTSSCDSRQSPQAAFDDAYRSLLHGDLKQAQGEAHRQCQRLRNSNPEWSWKFRTLEARALLQQGQYQPALQLLSSEPLPSSQPDLTVPNLDSHGEANAKMHNFEGAELALSEASALCATLLLPSCGYILKARGVLATERHQWESAEQILQQTLVFSRLTW